MTDKDVIDAILRREGGYVDHPKDRGGPTKFGITWRTLSDWRLKPVTADDVKALTESEARAIYQHWYVAPFAEAPDSIRPHLIDIAVNSGVVTAKTLRERAGDDPVKLVKERLRYYARIVKAKPTQAVFLESWINRALEFLG